MQTRFGWITFARMAIAIGIAAVAGAGPAKAQNFPSRPVRLVVPYPAGGYTDLLARALSPQLTAALGQPIVIESKPGAATLIGQEYVAKQPADGHTLLLAGASALTNALLRKQVPYRLEADFMPVSNVVIQPLALITSPASGANNLREFVAYFKTSPGKHAYAIVGKGAITHLTGEMMNAEMGINLFDVPYGGDAPAYTAMMRGDSHYILSPIGSAMPFVRDGRLRFLAVMGEKRLAIIPEVPTFAESGYPNFRYPGKFAGPWFGMFVAKGTPPAIASRLNAAVLKVLAQPEVIAYIERQGGIPSPTSPEEFLDQLNVELPGWAKVIQQLGLKAE